MLLWWMMCRFVYVQLVRLLWDHFFNASNPSHSSSSSTEKNALSPVLSCSLWGRSPSEFMNAPSFPILRQKCEEGERGEHKCDSKKVGKHCFPIWCIVFLEKVTLTYYLSKWCSTNVRVTNSSKWPPFLHEYDQSQSHEWTNLPLLDKWSWGNILRQEQRFIHIRQSIFFKYRNNVK